MESLKLVSIVVVLLSSCAVVSSVSGEAEKVKLELYYESLCPYCARFVVEFLPKLFETGLIDITEIKLYPYGNGFRLSNGTIYCQHGRDECLLNTVEACAIDAWPKLSQHFPFIYCVENLAYQWKYSGWKTCFEKLNLKSEPVIKCFEGARGQELDQHYAAETEALEPPNQYVPWVVVDGQPLYEDYENFIGYICKAYKGTAPTPACKAHVNAIRKGRKVSHLYTMKTATSKLSAISSALKSWMNLVKQVVSA